MSASYWLTLETMLEIEEKENLYSGALCSVALGPSCCRLTWSGLGLGSGLGFGFGLGGGVGVGVGSILHDLATTCVGKETYLRASYYP